MTDNAAAWFYESNDDRKGPFTPDQVSALIAAGVVNEHTRVWSERIAEWTPLFKTELRALLGERVISPPGPSAASAAPTQLQPAHPSVTAAAPQHRVYANRGLGEALYYVLYVNVAVSAGPLALLKMNKSVEKKYLFMKQMEADELQAVLGIFILASVVLFLVWKYRATANLFACAGPQSITPAGAVYWYFIPIAWFWKPYQAMRNLYDGFQAGTDGRYNLVLWWLLWLGSAGVAVLAAAAMSDPVITVEQQRDYINWNIALGIADAASFYFAAQVVKLVSAAETRAMSR